MGLTSISFMSSYGKTFVKPTPSSHLAQFAYSLNTNSLQSSFNQIRVQSHKTSCNGNCSYKRSHPVVALAASGDKDSGSLGEEQRAVETILKLYEGIKNRNVSELSDIIAEECLCISNFVSTFQPFHGKKQVLAFFSYLMKHLGNNIQFVIQNTLEDGMVVRVSWKLEWKDIPLPLGKGFSFCMCHAYKGKVVITSLEIFMEPLLHIVPLRLRIISLMMNAMEALDSEALIKGKATRARNILYVLLLIAATMFFLRHWTPR